MNDVESQDPFSGPTKEQREHAAKAELVRRAEAFLAEMSEVSKRHGMILDSCGDCQSMWVTPLDDEGSNRHSEVTLVEVGWDEKEGTYRGKG